MNIKSIAHWIEEHTLEPAVNEAAKDYGELEKILHTPLYPITDYHFKVSDELWRGSWPETADLAYLAAQGVKTIVNLCAERIQENAVNMPIIDNTAPSIEEAKQFLDILHMSGPVYVHCEQGKGRTGCIVAAYRVLVQKWDPAAALQEAVNFGMAIPAQHDWVMQLK